MSILLLSVVFCSAFVVSFADTNNRGGEAVNYGETPVASAGAEARQNFNVFGNPGSLNRRRCPQCDSSVFPYCADKLFHDACCCTDPYQFPLPQKCQFADCAFLHANSCREHRLIANCCCSDEYRSLLRGTGKSNSDADLAVADKIKMNQKSYNI